MRLFSFLSQRRRHVTPPPPHPHTHTHMHQNFPRPARVPPHLLRPQNKQEQAASHCHATLLHGHHAHLFVRPLGHMPGRQAGCRRSSVPTNSKQAHDREQRGAPLLSLCVCVCVIKGLFLEMILSSDQLRAYIPLCLGETKLGGRGGLQKTDGRSK